MLYAVLQGLFVLGVGLPLMILMGASSIEIKVKQGQVTESAIKAFLDALRFPFNIAYGSPQYSLYTASSRLPPEQYLVTPRSLLSVRLSEFSGAVILAVWFALLIAVWLRSVTLGEFLVYGFFVLCYLLLWIRTFRLGVRLSKFES